MKHHGVVFPEFIHQKIPFVYRGKRIPLDVYAELYVILFMKHSDKHRDPVFVSNFLGSFSKYIGVQIQSLNDVDLKPFKNRAVKRKKQPDASNVVIVKNKRCTYNPYVEPPTVFVGRGDHPKRGTIKPPVREVSLNTSNTVQWVAKYPDSLTGETKYIMVNNRDEVEKYDVARKLYRGLRRVRQRVNQGLKAGDETATCVAIIDATCMRVGMEKDASEEADTVGCCSLRVRHVHLLANHTIRFRFPGKDSIMWDTSMKNQHVHDNIRALIRNKKKDDLVFSTKPCNVNAFLQSIVPGTSAKCFRTCHASGTMSRLLEHATSIQEWKEANEAVAKKLCHVRGTSLSCATSKMNYIDPRVVFGWCKKRKIPIQKVYSKQLLEKHGWASSTSENFMY